MTPTAARNTVSLPCDWRCIECHSFIAHSYREQRTGATRTVLGREGATPDWVVLGMAEGMRIWGRPKRRLAGRDAHHREDPIFGSAMYGTEDYAPISDAAFLTYCPTCARRQRIAP